MGEGVEREGGGGRRAAVSGREVKRKGSRTREKLNLFRHVKT